MGGDLKVLIPVIIHQSKYIMIITIYNPFDENLYILLW